MSREARYWLLAGLVTAAITTSLVLDGVAARLMSNDNVSAALFSAGMLAIGLVVWAAPAAHRDPRRTARVLTVAAIVGAWLVLAARMTSAQERTHLIEYALLAALIHAALRERTWRSRPVAGPACLAAAIAATLGLVDELVQRWVPDRVFDPQDVLFNTLAAALAVSAGVVRSGRQAG